MGFAPPNTMTQTDGRVDTELHVMTRLYEVGVACATIVEDPEKCLAALLDASAELRSAQRAIFHVLERRSQRLTTRALKAWTPQEGEARSAMLSDTGSGMLATLRAGERIVVSDMDRDAGILSDAVRAACREAGIAAAEWTPLIGGKGQLLGVIEIHFAAPRTPVARDLRISDLLARQAADYLERRQIEADIKASEERFRAFTNATSDVIYRMNSDWTQMHQLQGREFIVDTSEPTSNWLSRYIPDDECERVNAAIRKAVQTSSTFELEHRVFRVDGTEGWTHSRAIPILDANGHITEWFGAASDVTPRYLAREALQNSEARYRTLFESIDEGYCIIRMVFDDDGRPCDYIFEEVNQSFERQTGLIGAEGRSMRSLAPEHEAHWFEVYGHIAVTGESRRFELVATALHRWYDVYAYRIGDPAERRVAVLFHDISDRKRAQDALKEADHRKDEFLATLAHELRNPLAPIRTGLDILKLSDGSRPAMSKVLQMLERQVGQMVHLVDDLLEVSRISRGTIELRRERVDLGDVLHNAVETSRPQIEAAHQRLSIELPGGALLVNGDAMRLAQVVSNLLNNAAKYTDGGGQIELSARRDGDWAVVTVRDNGMGIPREMLSKIFDWFMQVERTHPRGQGGLGVGLTIVRTLVEMHGGTVSASSEGSGQGAEFNVRLPLAEATDHAAVGQKGAARQQRFASKILVVDDNRDAAQSLCMLLQMRGAHVKALHDGESALEALDDFQPDTVLLDVGMPGMDGYELARRIRARDDGTRFQLVAITGWAQEEDRQRSRAAGIDHHLVKPVDMAALDSLLK